LPSPTAAPALHQLTQGSCCVQPFWSPDSQRILYLDHPSPDAPSGLWSVGLDGGAPEFFTDRLGIYSADMQMRAFLVGSQTVVENLATGERWTIPSGGRVVSFSPDGNWLAWTAGQSDPPFDRAQREIWISHSDGSQARNVMTVTGGGFSGWFPDGRLLVSSRLESPESGQVYWAVTLDDSGNNPLETVELGRGNRLRDAEISPDGRWLVYLVTFSEDPALDGIWLADSFTGERRRLDHFGAYRWRNERRLLIIPLDLEAAHHRLIQIEAATGMVDELTDPTITPFKVASGDWSVSPDGTKLIYVSALDRNIWLLSLPER
jgi:Tol biopolymer transport system component